MRVLDEADLPQLRSLQGGEELMWMDLCDPEDEQLDSVGEILGLHPLAIEDSREFGQRPKLDRYDDRFLLVFFGMNFTWLVDHQDGPWTFFLLGVGGMVASVLVIIVWLGRTGMTNRHKRPTTRPGRATEKVDTSG